jgi:hypothetical protein
LPPRVNNSWETRICGKAKKKKIRASLKISRRISEPRLQGDPGKDQERSEDSKMVQEIVTPST